MSDLVRWELRRAEGPGLWQVLVSVLVPVGQTVAWEPSLGLAPAGLVQWWVESSDGESQPVGEPFSYFPAAE